MKILQISSAKNFGGGEKHFVDLCRGLQNRGHEIFVVVRPTCNWQERLNFLPSENILSVSIRNSIGIFSANKIAQFIKENNIDIVHAHVARDYFPASLACRISKTPKFVLTRHVLFPMKTFYRFVLKNLGKGIAVSKSVEANLQKIFPKEKIVTISNGVNTENISDEKRQKYRESFRFEHDISSDNFVIGTVGELKQLKGQEDFVLAAQIVAKKYPKAFFVIVGKDNSVKKDFRQELKRLVKVFGLEDRFLWLDWVDDTTHLLNGLDLFVSASHTESFGLAIVEAMANKTCIVATKTEGAKEILQDNKTAMLCEIKNPVELSEKIIDLIENTEKHQYLTENAQIIVKERFNLQKMIDETEKVYFSL
jgi:L-malate glycosyltransferase